MILIDDGIALNARVPANPCSFSDCIQNFTGLECFGCLAALYKFCLPLALSLNSIHEFISNSYGHIAVLECDTAIRFTVHAAAVSLLYQCPRLLLLFLLCSDEIHYIWMVNIKYLHFRSPPCFSSRLDYASIGIISSNE